MSSQSAANEMGLMGYNLHQVNLAHIIYIICKNGLNSNILKSIYKIFPKICTHRPSLLSKDKISRNKVDVIEIASIAMYHK